MIDTPNWVSLPAAEFGVALRGVMSRYYSDARVNEIFAKQRLAYRYYYDLGLNWIGWSNTNGSTSSMTRGGDQGELAFIRINHARSLARNQIAMVTNAKFERHPRARRYDYESMEAKKRSKYALDHYNNNGGLELLRIERVESSTVLGEGFTHYEWAKDKGDEVAALPGQGIIVRTGDIDARDVLPWDVMRDPWKPWAQQRFIAVRFPLTNKYDLVAKYPKFAEKIMAAAPSGIAIYAPQPNVVSTLPTNDEAEVWRFYHLPCASLPRGRDTTVLCDGTVLEDHDLAWGCFPLVRVSESNIKTSSYGYPSFWEYLGVQELYDSLQSSVATNQTTFATQMMRVRPGVDPKPLQLGGGMSVIVADKDDIEAMQLTKSPAEVFPHMDSLVTNMTRLSGQSGVNRGEAQGDRQSGAALALLSAETIRNASPYQQSDVEALKGESQIILKMLQRNAKRPIRIAVASKGMPSRQMDLTGDMLGESSDVDIELANPLQQTMEGRIALLQTFAQLRLPVTLDQAMEMITSGHTEPVTDSITEQGLNILRENELLGQGQSPTALVTDDHMRHCREHLMVLSNPAARQNLSVLSAVMTHVGEHYTLVYGLPKGVPPQADPMYRVRIMELAGVQPPPSAMMPAPGDAQATQPPAGGAADGTQPPQTGQATATSAAAQGPQGVAGNPQAGKQPSMPKNAATGQSYNPVTAGGTPQPGAQ